MPPSMPEIGLAEVPEPDEVLLTADESDAEEVCTCLKLGTAPKPSDVGLGLVLQYQNRCSTCQSVPLEYPLVFEPGVSRFEEPALARPSLLASTCSQLQSSSVPGLDSRNETFELVSVQEPSARKAGQPFLRLCLAPFRISRGVAGSVVRRVVSVSEKARHFLRTHLRLLTTGESQIGRTDVGFSSIVAASSFLYLAPAAAFVLTRSLFMGALLGTVTVTSLLADSVYPNSKAWCITDRAVATLTSLAGPVRMMIHEASTLDFRVKVVVIACSTLVFLAWSRAATNQSEFVVRHTSWHVASAAGLVWLACEGSRVQAVHAATKAAVLLMAAT